MKTKTIVAGMAVLGIILLIVPVVAQITMITEFAGINIADQEAENWSYDAGLVQILIAETVIYETSAGNLKMIPSGWTYIYRSDGRYLEIVVNVTDYDNDTAGRIREITPTGQRLEELKNKTPLPSDRNWKITGNAAMDVAFDSYSISLEKDDSLSWLSLDMEDVGGASTPVWHVSISNGLTSIVTEYLINAIDATIINDTGTSEQNEVPVADAGGPYTGTKDEPISFSGGDSYDSDGDIVSYYWDFGDDETSIVQNPSHTYSDDGTYTVTLTVTDDDDETDTDTATVTVAPVQSKPPHASFNVSPMFPEVNQKVTFDASASYDSDGEIVSYQWDFGDGSTGTGVTASHFYPLVGSSTVMLTVTDDCGKTDIDTVTITTTPTDEKDDGFWEKMGIIAGVIAAIAAVIGIIIKLLKRN
jgi:PKD repeat protein